MTMKNNTNTKKTTLVALLACLLAVAVKSKSGSSNSLTYDD